MEANSHENTGKVAQPLHANIVLRNCPTGLLTSTSDTGHGQIEGSRQPLQLERKVQAVRCKSTRGGCAFAWRFAALLLSHAASRWLMCCVGVVVGTVVLLLVFF